MTCVASYLWKVCGNKLDFAFDRTPFFFLPHVKQWPTSQRGVDGSQYKEETSADDPFSDIMTHYGAQSPSHTRL